MELITNISKRPHKIFVLYKFQNSVVDEHYGKYGENCASLFDVTHAILSYFARSVF